MEKSRGRQAEAIPPGVGGKDPIYKKGGPAHGNDTQCKRPAAGAFSGAW